MTKLEKARVAHKATIHNELEADCAGVDFVAGARWALEQMTSEAAVKAFLLGSADDESDDPWAEVDAGLAAVRKEIES